MAEAPRVGVLFVHGIGEQEPGSTLVEWGEVLGTWLDDWGRGAGIWQRQNGLRDEALGALLAKVEKAGHGVAIQHAARSFADPLFEIPLPTSAVAHRDPRADTSVLLGGTCVLSEVTLAPGPGMPHVPAHGALTFTAIARDGTAAQTRVQLAEAHWANVFPVPRYGEFFRWATIHLPVILQAHLGWGLCQARAHTSGKWPARLDRAVEVVGWFLLSILLPVFPVLVLLLLALSLPLAYAPFGAARSFARRMQGVVANVLGDIYVLLERPARAAAIRERVRASYEWLAATCDEVVVIAHSQGAAVALDFLVDEQPAKVKRLITLGSGARKLAHLRFMRMGSTAYGTTASAWLAVTAPALAALVLYDLVHGNEPSWLSWGIVVVTVGWFLRTRWRHGSKDHLQRSREWKRLLTSMRMPWHDFPARTDPVSNGAHVRSGNGDTQPYSLRTRRVQNRGSLLSDHTTYWGNRSQFVARVASIIAEHAGIPLRVLTPADEETLSYAWFSHTFRVACLRLGRTVLWLTLLHVLLRGTAYVEQIGGTVIGAGTRIPADWVPKWLVSILNGVLGVNFGMGRNWLAGAITFAVLTLFAQNMWLSSWRVIDAMEVQRMFRRRANPISGQAARPVLPDLLFLGYGIALVVVTWRTFFRYVSPPPVVSLETAVAVLLLVLNLKDLATCFGFVSRSLGSMAKRRPAAGP